MRVEFKITHKYNGNILFEVEAGSLRLALELAIKARADLRGADLRDADLRDADLRGADLRGADLGGAKGINPYLQTDLLMLLDQPGKIRAYKLVNRDGEGIYQGGITYAMHSVISINNANCNPNVNCGAGINVATLPWCMREWQEGYRILILELEAEDIACIPTATDGKFRLHRATVVGEKDLEQIGLVSPSEAA